MTDEVRQQDKKVLTTAMRKTPRIISSDVKLIIKKNENKTIQ